MKMFPAPTRPPLPPGAGKYDSGWAVTPTTFTVKIVQKQATPEPVTIAVGTGSSATRVEFFMAWGG